MADRKEIRLLLKAAIDAITAEYPEALTLVCVAMRDEQDTGYDMHVVNNCEPLLPLFAKAVFDSIKEERAIPKTEVH